MLFSSLVFLFLFLPIVTIVHQAIMLPIALGGRRAGALRHLANTWLLLASLFFYAWGEWRVLWVMLVLIGVNHVCGLGIARARERAQAAGTVPAGCGRSWLLVALLANLGMLGFYKYANFVVDNYDTLATALGLQEWAVRDFAAVALPLGISFYTFQALSYTLDVYWGRVAATRNAIDFACYVTMFPQLVAGPIVRYTDIAEELRSRRIGMADMSAGVTRFCVGLAKKVLVANTVAAPADAVFSMPLDQVTTGHAWLGIVGYTLQIYFDFSAYSDMAIGLGRIFGFHFNENFRYPYVARSNQDFWRRWHISLSTWFRDYLYIPLGGNQRGAARTYVNLGIVFFLCGLWHGASWNFVLWGLYHGLFLVLERRFLLRWIGRLWLPLQHVYLLLLTMVGWVLFRAESTAQIGTMLGAMFGGGADDGSARHLFGPDLQLALVLGAVFSMPVVPAFLAMWRRWQEGVSARGSLVMECVSSVVRPCVVILLLIASAMVLSAGTHNPFIYFRF